MANTKGTSTKLQDIESHADYYPPSAYGLGANSKGDSGGLPSLLSFYSSLSLESDPATEQFIPISTVPQRSRNTKLFAVGIIPPVQNVTGRLLDRTASLRSSSPADMTLNNPSQEELTDASNKQVYEEVDSIGTGVNTSAVASDRVAARNQEHIAQLHASFQPLVEEMIRLAQQQGIILTITSSFRSSSEQDALYQKGRTTGGAVVTNAQAGQSWHNYGLAVDFAVYNSSSSKVEIPNPPPAAVLAEVWGPIGAIGTGLGMNWGKSYGDYPHFDWHPGVPNTAAAAAGQRPTTAVVSKAVQADSASGGTWVDQGSRSADDARDQIASQAQTKLHLDWMEAQSRTINATRLALQSMANTPPLRFLVNPNKFAVKAQKIVSDGSWTRKGPIIEFWGDDQDKISGSGQVAAFYAIDKNPPNPRGAGPGLTRTARNASQAYQNFQSLWLLYKNNGVLHMSETLTQSDRDFVLSTVGSVYIYYDNILYIGSFDSFNVTEEDTKPFSLSYDFEFTVRAAFLLDRADDFDYSANQPESKLSKMNASSLPTRSNRLRESAVLSDPAVKASQISLANATTPQETLAAQQQAVSSIEEAI